MPAGHEIARSIVAALDAARARGAIPEAIVLDASTQGSLEAVGFGYWAAGVGLWSVLGVPARPGIEGSGWSLRCVGEAP